jgi:hypothetical protein
MQTLLQKMLDVVIDNDYAEFQNAFSWCAFSGRAKLQTEFEGK